ncbi:MAG: fibronectin type III domain-containing protein [Draconibacterium sp.]
MNHSESIYWNGFGRLVFTCLAALLFVGIQIHPVNGQPKKLLKKAEVAAGKFSQEAKKSTPFSTKFDTVIIDNNQKTFVLKMADGFSDNPFREENTKDYYSLLKDVSGRKFRKYSFSIETMGKEISDLIPNYYRTENPKDAARLSVQKTSGPVLVENISKNTKFTEGLNGRHIALWHSHGWYYENTLDRWEWQRARVFQTVEDIWTMSFVVPYIAVMLENAGANVLIPRERDTQQNEIIVDADGSSKNAEYIESGNWQPDNRKGFGLKVPFYFDGENPFEMGETRKLKTDTKGSASVQYLPDFPESGSYSVSVSYGPDAANITGARYTVHHAGGKTEFSINQQMGGGTWIYLGTFQFEKGKNPETGSVELSNKSGEPGGFVSADAVKFGGGTSNIVRGKTEQLEMLRKIRDEKGFETDSSLWLPFASRRPRYQEAARYYLQYAGMPDSTVYSINRQKEDYSHRGTNAALYAARESGKEDYKDDYMSRGEWVNYLMGISTKTGNPAPGLNIPVELALAFHTDAGITPDSAIIGTLGIYNTTVGADTFPNGLSKWSSRDLCDIIQTQVTDDLRRLYEPEWTRRGMWNKQYSEAVKPKVPTMLSEFLSHQNFADMALATDPRFKFDVSRSFYKGILRFLSAQNGTTYTVQPLPVSHFSIQPENNRIRLSWKPVADPLEPMAVPTSYRIYKRLGNNGFDNGTDVTDTTFVFNEIKPGVIYSFKVAAVNSGGESFPSEILACSFNGTQKPVLVVNAFDRICAPAVFDNGKEAGFNNAEDEGVAYINDIAFIGEQYDSDRKSPWKDDDASGFGSSHADQEALVKPGNSFDYPLVHGAAIVSNGGSFISMSDEAFETGNWDKNSFAMLDIIFGEEKTTRRLYGTNTPAFTLFTPAMRNAIEKYASAENAKILVSGAYVGTDLELCGDTLATKFAASVLHYRHMTNHASKSGKIFPVNSMKTDFPSGFHFVQNYNPAIYKVESPDAIEPVGNEASVLFRYQGDQKSAVVANNGKTKTMVFGFPFETITTDTERNELMGQILKYFGIK